MINFELVWQSLPALLHGTVLSIIISITSCIIGFVGGSVLAIVENQAHPILRALTLIFVTIIRGTPMLIQISFAFFVLPYIGISASATWIAIWAIGLNSSAYVSQVIKAGIMAVSKGQIEAAKLLGLTRLQTIRYIIFPQALRVTLPALGNEFITLLKDSSLASTIGVTELFKQGQIIISRSYDVITIYCIIAVIYLVLTNIIQLMITYANKRMNKDVTC